MPPIPTIVIPKSSPSLIKSGSIGTGKFLLKNWYIIFIIISLIPVIITSIHTAKETNNPYYPFIQVGVSVINADSVIYDNIQVLKTDPAKIIGMDKPEVGIYQKTKYSFKVFLFVWKLLGLIFLVTFSFTLIYKFVNRVDDSKKWRSLFRTLLIGFLIIFIVNLITIIINQASGNSLYLFADSLGFFDKAKLIITWVFPFHGIVSLISYLINLI